MENTSPPASRKRSGFEIFLYFLLGVGVLFFAAAIVGLYLLLTTEKGQRLVRGMKEMSTLTMEAMSAPGTEQLRALGCQSSFITTTGRLAEATGRLGSKAAPAEPGAERKDLPIVVCYSTSLLGRAPDCPAVAVEYAAAVDAPAEFAVAVVNTRPVKRTKCQGLFGPSGEKLRDLESSAAEPTPRF